MTPLEMILLQAALGARGLVGTTWNPADKSASCTLSGGNLTAVFSSTGGYDMVRSVFGASSGKWYWEITANAALSDNRLGFGVVKATESLTSYLGSGPGGYGYIYAGNLYNNASVIGTAPSFVGGAVVGVALDLDAGKLWFLCNGTWISGDPAAGTSPSFSGLAGTFFAAVDDGSSGGVSNSTANFGATAFVYGVPAGFTAGFGA